MPWLCSSTGRGAKPSRNSGASSRRRVDVDEPARVLEVQAVDVGARAHRPRPLGVEGVGVDGADRVREADHDLLDALGLREPRHLGEVGRGVHRVGDLHAPQAVAHHAAEHERA